jgi:predicted P-loop ATPase
MAYHAYKLGESFYLNDEQETEREESNKQFESSDAIEDLIIPYVSCKENIIIADVLIALNLRVDDKGLQMRVGDILKKNKWSKKTGRIDGNLRKYWSNPNPISTFTKNLIVNQTEDPIEGF